MIGSLSNLSCYIIMIVAKISDYKFFLLTSTCTLQVSVTVMTQVSNRGGGMED